MKKLLGMTMACAVSAPSLANEFGNITRVMALQMLPILKDSQSLGVLFSNRWSDSIQERDEAGTITVKRPVMFDAIDFTHATGITIQDAKRTTVDISLDTITDVSFELTDTEASLIMKNDSKIRDELTAPAVEALTQRLNTALAERVTQLPYHVGDPTKPYDVRSISKARSALNKRRVPIGERFGLWSPDAEENLLTVDAILNAEKSGSTESLRNASLGKVMGMDHFVSQSIINHTVGTAINEAGATFAINGAIAIGDTSIVLATTNVADTKTLKKGDLLTVISGGKEFQLIVTADAVVTANAVTISVNPAPAVLDDASEVIFAGAGVLAYDKNFVGHKNAIGFTMIPLRKAGGNVDQAVVTQDGYSFRITRDYDINKKKTIVSVDVFFGTQVMWDVLGNVVIGGGSEE